MKSSKKALLNLILPALALLIFVGTPGWKSGVHQQISSSQIEAALALNHSVTQPKSQSFADNSEEDSTENLNSESNPQLSAVSNEVTSEEGALHNIGSVIKQRKVFQLDSEAFSGNVFQFNPFPGHNYQILPVSISNSDSSTVLLYGNIVDKSGAYLGTASIARVQKDGEFGYSGTFTLDNGVSFNLGHDQSGNEVIEQVNEEKLPSCGTDHLNTPSHSKTTNTAEVLADVKNSVTPVSVTGTTTTNLIPISLMVLYTPQARVGAGGTAAIEARARESVAVANQDYLNSKVYIRLNLVYLGEVSYNEDQSFATNLIRLTDKTDGYLDEVHALRDQYQADMVALLVDSMEYCGLGWVTAPSDWAADYMFSVTNQYCAPFHTLAHELGHNMGANHDKPNAGGEGAYRYSYGYHFGDGQYRTIMAYAPGVRVGYFSNPNIRYNGYRTGATNKIDNARTLNNMAPMIAGFRGQSFSISGTVTQLGLPLAGVKIKAGGLGTRVTDQNGVYSFPKVFDGTSYRLTASLRGYTFSPATISGTASDNVSKDFSANNLPQLSVGEAQRLGAIQSVNILASDLESSVADLSYSAQALEFSREYYQKNRLSITGSFTPVDKALRKDKVWFSSATSDSYFVTKKGSLYRYNGVGQKAKKVGTVAANVFTNPRLLAKASKPRIIDSVGFSFDENALTIQPNSLTGKFLTIITVTDENGGSTSKTVAVTAS